MNFQWNEKEQMLVDELWIILEDKLELRKKLVEARQAVSDKLDSISLYEQKQGQYENVSNFWFISLFLFGNFLKIALST